jgi:hypothetical protein
LDVQEAARLALGDGFGNLVLSELEPLGMRRDPAQDFDHLPYRIIIHSEGMYFIGWIRIHTSPSADFRLWPPLPTCAVQKVGWYLGYTGRASRTAAIAVFDPTRGDRSRGSFR